MFQIGSCGYKIYRFCNNCRCLCYIAVNSSSDAIMDNAYTYYAVSNVLSVISGESVK